METVFFSFFQTLIRMEAVFWSTEIVFFNKFFILASGKGFWQNINLLLLFGALFCCRTPFLKLNVGQFKKKKKTFLLVETILLGFCRYSCEWKQLLRLVETEFSSNPLSLLVYSDFELVSNRAFLFRAFLLLLESIIEIRCKPVFFNFSNSGRSFSD